MSAPQQKRLPELVENQHGNWRSRAIEQYAACLAATGKRQDLEALLQDSGHPESEAAFRFYLALALTREGDLTKALDQLRQVLAMQPDRARARELAYRLLIQEATKRVAAEDWRGLSDVVAEALAAAPAGVDPTQDLAAFQRALPGAHIRSGRREEAIKLWEDELRQTPGARGLLHNLALAHFWWAQGQEKRGDSTAELTDAWNGSIAYWTLLLNDGDFWQRWNENRGPALALSGEDLISLRGEFAEEHLSRHLQNKVSQYREQGNSDSAQLFENLLLAHSVEQKSAAAWREAVRLLDTQLPNQGDEALLRLPGGFLFFDRFGLVPAVLRASEKLPKESAMDCLGPLTLFFSPDGLGLIAALVDEGHQPALALSHLQALPEEVRSSRPARYLLVRALSEMASVHAAHGKITEAVEAWKQARKNAQQCMADSGKTGGFPAATFQEALSRVDAEAAKAVERESTRLRKEDKLDEAIKLVEGCLEFDLRELLCAYYCDRAAPQLGAKKYAAAREDFNRALYLDPQYQRATQGLSNCYNNEACELKDLDEAVKLFQKALELYPDNHQAKLNLDFTRREIASVLREKAVQEINKAVERANAGKRTGLVQALDDGIAQLERAAKLVDARVGSEVLEGVAHAAIAGDASLDEALKPLEDAVLKDILLNLGRAYRMRFTVPK